jgi:hypothetical protein
MINKRSGVRWSAAMMGTVLALAACSGSPEDEGSSPGPEENDIDSVTTKMQNWTDICDVFDPDVVTAQLHIEAYTEGPNNLGLWEGNFPGGLKCNASYSFPDYPLPENASEQDLGGTMYMVLVPYGDSEEAALAYEDLYGGEAERVREQSEDQQVVDREIAGDWDRGALLGAVGSGLNRSTATYLKDSYLVFIQISYDVDPGVRQALFNTSVDTFADPTYEFTPVELADWFEEEYLPNLYQTITKKAEE